MVSGPVTIDHWLAATKHRRTIHGLKGTSPISDSRVEDIVEQPVRITLVTGEKHKQFWDIIIGQVEPILKGAGEQVWTIMSGVFQAHNAAYGSVRLCVDASAAPPRGVVGASTAAELHRA
ncbi:hypothetical protein B0J13DRAFT_526576 [Dactylonectria estremocensis]|uniref:Uncharacterized protein n=1 Tax=Dactylonectria estremocensis TaxID=1079267 RepID=A0A9P9J434_9HYPO|nr:hypothetical protein B0J13DRAFT_526576 [Dactylonectria estremocensis]